jgi:hypothetical protein
MSLFIRAFFATNASAPWPQWEKVPLNISDGAFFTVFTVYMGDKVIHLEIV